MGKERKFFRKCFCCGKICWDIKVGSIHEQCLIDMYKEEGYDLTEESERMRFHKDHVITVKITD